jgi:uridine kinase
MEKRNIISLAGELSSGKGTVSKILMKQLNPNIIPNRIEKVDKLEKTARGKKQRA